MQQCLYSFVEGLRFLVSGPLILDNAYCKVRIAIAKTHAFVRMLKLQFQASGKPFAVPTLENELVMVTSERHLAELNKAHHSQLSLHAVAKEVRVWNSR